MKILHHQRKLFRFFYLASCAFILMLLCIIPVRLAIAYYQHPNPQAILTLGGGSDREKFTAQFAQAHPSLKIWVSSGTVLEEALVIFRGAGIPDTRVNIDTRAVDTVTNFTTLVADFKRLDIHHIYLITSEFHMPRAKAIAYFVLGSQGIAFTSVTVPSKKPPESWLHVLRDSSRAVVWIITGRTGASLNPNRAAQTKNQNPKST